MCGCIGNGILARDPIRAAIWVSPLIGRLSQICSARKLKTAFAAIAADNLLDGDVLVGRDLVPDGDGDRLAEVFQGLLLPGRIVPKIERFLGGRRHEHDQRLVTPARATSSMARSLSGCSRLRSETSGPPRVRECSLPAGSRSAGLKWE